MRDLIWQYHQAGWPLLMLPPGRKGKPMFAPHGVYDATTDPAKVQRLAWFGWPPDRVAFNVAVALGHGLLGVDDDPYHGSEETKAKLASQGFILPPTRRHRTPHGGFHWLYLADGVTGWWELGPGLTVRGYGSYLVLPPSVLVEDGREVGAYSVEDPRPLIAAPSWLREPPDGAIHTPAQGRGCSLDLAAWDSARVDGHRPELLEAMAERVALGWLPSHLIDIVDERLGDRSGGLWHLVAASLEVGLTDGEAMALAHLHEPSAEKYGGRLADETARCLSKLRPRHQHSGQACDDAGCPHRPDWQRGGGRA